MSIRAFSESPNIPRLEYKADQSVHYTKGALLYRDTSSGEVKEATAGAGTTLNIECISAEDVTTGSGSARVDGYVINGPGQLWVADCAADAIDTHLNLAHIMTSATIVNNTTTASESSAGVFVALAVVGASSDKKLLGYFVKVGQVTA